MRNVFIASESCKGSQIVVLVSYNKRTILSILKKKYNLDKNDTKYLTEHGEVTLLGEDGFFTLNLKEYEPNILYNY